jgi:hypothetical protein
MIVSALAAFGTWMASKAIPWKWIGILVAILILVGVGAGIYLHVDGLKKDLIATNQKLATEELLKKEAEARADDIMTQHSLQVERIETLEDQRRRIAGEVMTLRKTIQDLDIEGDLESDNAEKADGAIARLNARNVQLNRLLEHASGKDVVRAERSAPGKASKAGTPSALQRALEALR